MGRRCMLSRGRVLGNVAGEDSFNRSKHGASRAGEVVGAPAKRARRGIPGMELQGRPCRFCRLGQRQVAVQKRAEGARVRVRVGAVVVERADAEHVRKLRMEVSGAMCLVRDPSIDHARKHRGELGGKGSRSHENVGSNATAAKSDGKADAAHDEVGVGERARTRERRVQDELDDLKEGVVDLG